ncbi:hypothetical protein GU243_06140 [Pseudarthrobacter psychrotolerans]|uniref:Uncharacterized protein n=1 Tax=Pseudarthrobacter psychrotolerans TaxID=2697569 RepID=A0A6P1NPC3_9MICC|nr:hypothetical protein [Pseudarthrobacter psychrotolerans]QHK19392.1 hypothetical protein GU243_06140 [Pseudarthrobacter psychrotolerans]
MTTMQEALQAAAAVIEEDVRKMDAGELEATPEQRAFLIGTMRGLQVPLSVEIGG